jgi:ubiquinone/menaquinone biosynthesis C-methylase UbiE
VKRPKIKEIKDYWEDSPPMSFVGESVGYEEKRRFRYSLQDYMPDAFQFSDFGGKLVLDLGCGAGIDSAEFCRNGATVVSVDLTAAATRLTRDLLTEAGFPPLVLQAEASALPFKSDTFDCVYCFGVLHHIVSPKEVVAEINRVLKPGGQVMAMLYHKDSLLYAYSIVYLRGIKEGLLDKLSLDEILSRYSERREGCPYTRVYTKAEARELFRENFEDIQVAVHYTCVDLPSLRKAKVAVSDEHELGWHLIVKGRKPVKK